MAVRTHRRLVLDDRRLDDARPDGAATPDRGVDQLAAGADDGPLPDRCPATQDDVGLQDDVRCEGDVPVEVDRRGVAHRDPVAHVGLVALDPQVPLGGGEL
jgi:hypothetical protein